ncbi:outer membrane lipoprotein chaperone LolA [bacterium]|nr:outer membrane lipoprotein chaperone LolA [bacterium]
MPMRPYASSAFPLIRVAVSAMLALCLWATRVSASDVVDRVQARYDATKDFTAAVQQELVMASGGKTMKASGSVAFKRPGKMRWTLRDGVSQVIVADGRTLWFYEPDEQQVLKAPFQNAFRSSTPISFLTGVGKLRDDFDVTVEASGAGPLRLRLKPRGDADLGTLILTVDPHTYDITGAEVTDPIGNVTKLQFSDLRRNVGLADEAFQFEAPPGVDVVEAPIGN